MVNTAIFVVLWLGAKFDLVNPSPSSSIKVWEGEDPRMASCYGTSCCKGVHQCNFGNLQLSCNCNEHLQCKVSKVKQSFRGEPYDEYYGECRVVDETKLELIRKSVEKCSGDKCSGYRGTRDKTLTGRTCKPWSTVDNSDGHLGSFVDNGLVENYCRNPKKLREDIWCYTGLKEKEWEYCSLGYSPWSEWTGCESCYRRTATRSRTGNSDQGTDTQTIACSSVRSSCRGLCKKSEKYCKSRHWFTRKCSWAWRTLGYDCTKTTWADTHFETLDNKFYEFDGECAYNYLTDKKRSFNLIIYTVPCGQLTNRTGTCLDQIDVSYKNTSISLKKDLKLEISNKYLDLPFENEDLDIHEASAEFVQVHFSNEISFLWNGDEIVLDVPESLIGQYPDYKIFGLVGPYNNNSNDDFTSPDGKLLGSPKAFGESWKVPGSCVDHTELKKKISLKALQKIKNYQKQNKDAAMVAQQQCNNMKTGIFKLCHDKMDPNQFKNLHNACVWDVSSCVGDISECLCHTLEVLSEECHQSGFAVGNWRKTISQCEKICQNGDVFQQCASPCNRTCQHMQSANICLETCVEGCACPKGMTRDVPGKHGKCIPHENCGCKFGNHTYTKGQSISRDGKKITCDGTFWHEEKGAE